MLGWASSKNELSHRFLKFLTKKTNEYTYKELAAEFKCNFEHARRICIKIFTEGKIELTKIVKRIGRPYFKYWKYYYYFKRYRLGSFYTYPISSNVEKIYWQSI